MSTIHPLAPVPDDSRYALTAEQLRVLRAVARLQGATVDELLTEVGGSSRVLRRTLRRLVSDGRVEKVWRTHGGADRPAYVHEVTWHGMATLAHPVVAQLQVRRTA